MDHHLQPITKARKSYIKDTGDFFKKLKNLGNIQSNAILITADVVGLYRSILYDGCLQSLYEELEERTDERTPYTELIEIVEFILKKIFF